MNTNTVMLLGYPKVIPYTKFEHFGIIRFCVMLRTIKKQTHRQTNKQTDSNILPTPVDIVYEEILFLLPVGLCMQ